MERKSFEDRNDGKSRGADGAFFRGGKESASADGIEGRATATMVMRETPSIRDAQEFLGGDFETSQTEGARILVGENAQARRFPINPTASQLARRPIYGNAIFLRDPLNGCDCDQQLCRGAPSASGDEAGLAL